MTRHATISRYRTTALGLVLLLAAAGRFCAASMSLDEAITACGNRLVQQQTKTGSLAGTWPDEADYTGSIVAGLVRAYQAKGHTSYKTAAELGGDYITDCDYCNFFGDEAFSLTLLSEVSGNPAGNAWRTALAAFYARIKAASGGTSGYIAGFAGYDPGIATFYLAHHVLAAYYVGAADRLVWRQSLINYLAWTDDSRSYFPVLALGAATWALALTGPLDSTLINPSGTGSAYWTGKKLQDLPALLVSHQVPPGQPNAGSFYWRFDHGSEGPNDPKSGYSEDAAFAVLGLMAAAGANPSLNLGGPIIAARQALLGGVRSDGSVAELLTGQGAVYAAYAGEALHGLSELVLSGWGPGSGLYDLDGDAFIGPGDFSLFACCWLKNAADQGCSGSVACADCDFDCDSAVGPGDLSWFATGWLKWSDDPAVLLPPCQQAAPAAQMAMASGTPSTEADVRIRVAALAAASACDTLRTLPPPILWVDEGQDYCVEVWAADVGMVHTGLTSVYVDLIWDRSGASVRSIDHGGVFTELTGGVVVAGRIDELGGSTLMPVDSEPLWVRVAAVGVHAETSGPVAWTAVPSAAGVAALGRGLIAWSRVDLQTADAAPACGDPDWPYPTGDLDGDCRVTSLDLGLFAGAWLGDDCDDSKGCGGGDLDANGRVDWRDFCLLADHWLTVGGQRL